MPSTSLCLYRGQFSMVCNVPITGGVCVHDLTTDPLLIRIHTIPGLTNILRKGKRTQSSGRSHGNFHSSHQVPELPNIPMWMITAGLGIPASVVVSGDWLAHLHCATWGSFAAFWGSTICQARTRVSPCCSVCDGFLHLAVMHHTMCSDSVSTSKTWIWDPVPSSVPTCLFFDQNQTHGYSGTCSSQCHPKSDNIPGTCLECWLLAHPGSAVLACALSTTGWEGSGESFLCSLSLVWLPSWMLLLLRSWSKAACGLKGRPAAPVYRRSSIPSIAVCDRGQQRVWTRRADWGEWWEASCLLNVPWLPLFVSLNVC